MAKTAKFDPGISIDEFLKPVRFEYRICGNFAAGPWIECTKREYRTNAFDHLGAAGGVEYRSLGINGQKTSATKKETSRGS